jgi:beta-ketodecanoyl-[acyl-carrier-protein] synthase
MERLPVSSAIKPVISATGLYTPPNSITNEELVDSFNRYVELYNAEHAAAIEVGEVAALTPSSVEFIEKASGIKTRFVVNKDGILDPSIMAPRIPERPNEELSILAELAVRAARQALERAGRDPMEVDAVICAASNMQRAYPAMAIEIQAALGCNPEGFAFDECGLLLCDIWYSDSGRLRSRWPCAQRAGGQSRDLLGSFELQRSRQPLHLWRCRHGHSDRGRRCRR